MAHVRHTLIAATAVALSIAGCSESGGAAADSSAQSSARDPNTLVGAWEGSCTFPVESLTFGRIEFWASGSGFIDDRAISWKPAEDQAVHIAEGSTVWTLNFTTTRDAIRLDDPSGQPCLLTRAP